MKMIVLLLVVFLPMAVAILIPFFGEKAEKTVFLVAAAELALTIILFFCGSTAVRWEGFCSVGIGFATTTWQAGFPMIAAACWCGTPWRLPRKTTDFFSHRAVAPFWLLALGATQALLLSGDLFTTFVFTEVLIVSSAVLILHLGTDEALKAARVYFPIAVLGGLLMMTGMFMLWHEAGTLEYALLHQALSGERNGETAATAILMLLGLGIIAGAFPLYPWLPAGRGADRGEPGEVLTFAVAGTSVLQVILLAGTVYYNSAFEGGAALLTGAAAFLLGLLLMAFSVDLRTCLAGRAVIFVGALAARAAESLVDGTAWLLGQALYYKQTSTVRPKLDEEFGTFPKEPGPRRGFRFSFANSLMMMGIGLVAALLYVVLIG